MKRTKQDLLEENNYLRKRLEDLKVELETEKLKNSADVYLPFNRTIKVSPESKMYLDEFIFRLYKLFECIEDALGTMIEDAKKEAGYTSVHDECFKTLLPIIKTSAAIKDSIFIFKNKGRTVPCEFCAEEYNHDLEGIDNATRKPTSKLTDKFVKEILQKEGVIKKP